MDSVTVLSLGQHSLLDGLCHPSFSWSPFIVGWTLSPFFLLVTIHCWMDPVTILSLGHHSLLDGLCHRSFFCVRTDLGAAYVLISKHSLTEFVLIDFALIDFVLSLMDFALIDFALLELIRIIGIQMN
jgi:hypothetical protein